MPVDQKKHPGLQKTKGELYNDAIRTQGISSETQRANTAILDMLFTELTNALNDNADSANKLSKQLLILNIIMAAAAMVAVIIGLLQLYFQLFK